MLSSEAKNEEENFLKFVKNFSIGAISGSFYGAINVVIGQPFDTVKTKMQAQPEFLTKHGFFSCFKESLKKDGVLGVYKGSMPALLGSISFRSVQWAVYDSVYGSSNQDFFQTSIPFTGGLQIRVVFSSIIAATSRAIVECPFEYIKVRRQIGKSWALKDSFRGFSLVWARDVPLFIIALGLIDTLKRYTNLMESYPGTFLGTGICASISWACIWPLETLKNQVQAEKSQTKISIKERLIILEKLHGKMGAFRGIVPGMLGIFFRTGSAFVGLKWSQSELKALIG